MSKLVIFVVVVASLAVAVKSEDHRCRFTETKIENCTRTVYYPCPTSESTDSSQESDEDSSEESHHHGRKKRSIDDFIASIIRRWYGGDDDESDSNWCQREEMFKCVMYRCYIGCCPGWKFDETTGTCSIREDEEPGIECQNGGTAVRGPDGWRCECPRLYTGSLCGEAKCDLECENGMCDIVRGQPRCICSENFNGTRCEKPICKGGCNEHGRCEAVDGRAICRCQTGYRGRNCEHSVPKKEKEGACPPVTATSVRTCAETCEMDSNCPNNQKCCYNGCGHMCTHPANYTCQHQGRSYKIGDVFYPDKCHVCTCLNPDPNKDFGGAQCRKPNCPSIGSCELIQEDPETCCKYCADPVDEVEPYSEPRFKNCPGNIVTIDVLQDRNEAQLPFTLTAVDYKGNNLDVTLTRTVFRAGLGEENFDTVIATSERDEQGRYAYCEFHVRIRDVHAPNFTFCPTDVYLTDDGPAEWDLPQATDNVGLVRLPTSGYNSGDHFRKGEHPVVYTAEDYEGNIARCHFFVKVGHPDASRMSRDPEHHRKQRQLMLIVSGIAAFLGILFIIIVVVMCRRCRKNRRDASAATSSAPPAYENGIYNIGTIMPPPYKEKPPVYISETDSIAEKKGEGKYEEIEEVMDEKKGDKEPLDADDVDVKMGVDNPTYRL